MLLWLSDNEQVKRLSDLTPMHYKRCLLHKEKDGASPQYINDILRVMRTFSRFLYDEGYTPKTPYGENQKREATEKNSLKVLLKQKTHAGSWFSHAFFV